MIDLPACITGERTEAEALVVRVIRTVLDGRWVVIGFDCVWLDAPARGDTAFYIGIHERPDYDRLIADTGSLILRLAFNRVLYGQPLDAEIMSYRHDDRLSAVDAELADL